MIHGIAGDLFSAFCFASIGIIVYRFSSMMHEQLLLKSIAIWKGVFIWNIYRTWHLTKHVGINAKSRVRLNNKSKDKRLNSETATSTKKKKKKTNYYTKYIYQPLPFPLPPPSLDDGSEERRAGNSSHASVSWG